MKMRDDEKTRALGLVSDLSEKLFALPFISDDPENRELQEAYYQV